MTSKANGSPPLAIEKQRLDALLAIERKIDGDALPAVLVELVRLRVSQVNGCAFCIAMHRKALEKEGFRPDRIAALDHWRECPDFTPRERAALKLAEHLTQTCALPHVVEDEMFSSAEYVELVLAVAMINMWNRLAAGLRW